MPRRLCPDFSVHAGAELPLRCLLTHPLTYLLPYRPTARGGRAALGGQPSIARLHCHGAPRALVRVNPNPEPNPNLEPNLNPNPNSNTNPYPNPNPNPEQERCERALFERLHEDPSQLERRQAVTMALDVALT